MSDKVNSLLVIFDENISEECAEKISQAILQMKHVISVSSNVADFDSIVSDDRARLELGEKILNFLYPKHGMKAM